MLTVFIFTDRPHRYALTKDSTGSNLPTDGYDKWKHFETRHYQLNDNKFPLLPYSANDFKREIEANGYFIIDAKLFEQL